MEGFFNEIARIFRSLATVAFVAFGLSMYLAIELGKWVIKIVPTIPRGWLWFSLIVLVIALLASMTWRRWFPGYTNMH